MKLKEVLINLLSNAVKYTPENGKISFTAEQVTKYQDMCTLRFIVRDNGIGISEEYLPKLFEAFSQEAEDGSNQYGSTGLGMAITKSLVQLMNGEISVTSKKGKGSIFSFTVTLKDAQKGVVSAVKSLPKNNTEEKTPTPAEPAGSIENLRVMIVEDMKINAELIKKVLGMKGVSYDWAENGQIAVDLFAKSRENYYDAILMDIRMPVMDGLEATKSIRALERADAKTVQIIAMSANAFAEDIQRSLQAGMNAHLSKPVDMNLLFETLGKVAAHEPLK
ncbi:MAG: response regulator [Butyrivibrio sp.]|nr:response regulator [Butyrivibrio sp.]